MESRMKVRHWRYFNSYFSVTTPLYYCNSQRWNPEPSLSASCISNSKTSQRTTQEGWWVHIPLASMPSLILLLFGAVVVGCCRRCFMSSSFVSAVAEQGQNSELVYVSLLHQEPLGEDGLIPADPCSRRFLLHSSVQDKRGIDSSTIPTIKHGIVIEGVVCWL